MENESQILETEEVETEEIKDDFKTKFVNGFNSFKATVKKNSKKIAGYAAIVGVGGVVLYYLNACKRANIDSPLLCEDESVEELDQNMENVEEIETTEK